jgi:zinc-ribbon domain
MQQLNAPSVRWEWIAEAWKLFTNSPGAWIGMILISAVIGIVLVVLPFTLIFIPMGIFASNSEPGAALATAGLGLLLLIPVLLIVIFLATAYLWSGMYSAAIRQVKGEAISVGDLFSGGDCFLRVLGLIVLVTIAQLAVRLAFSVPGLIIEELAPLGRLASSVPSIIISGFIFFAIPLIVDRKMGVFEAISASVNATKAQWWMFAIFVFVLGLLSGIGVLGCLVGVLVTAPFYFTTPAVAYRDTFGLPGAQNYEAFPPPPPDYRDYAPSQAPAQPQAPAWEPPPNYGSAPTPEAAAKTCPHCGATLARAVNFCNQCGRPLRGA